MPAEDRGPPQRMRNARIFQQLSSAPKSEFQRLSSIGDPSLVRGTTPALLLECFGHRLRGTIGGLGTVSSDGDAEYARSFAVKKVDTFLSHSWHADWWRKYLLLLLHFNLVPALVASVSVGLCIVVLRPKPSRASEGTDLHKHLCWTAETSLRTQFSVVGGGLAAFLATLLSWHVFSSRCRGCSPSVFLDKVCIHQSDLARKERGIRAIGSILSKTDTMLVAWDPSYFSRLWCVYELSAFSFVRSHRNEGSIVIRPMRLSLFLLGFCTVAQVSHTLAYIFWQENAPSSFTALDALQAEVAELAVCTCFFLPATPLAFRLRTFTKERVAMKRQLASFSVRETLCFCCTHNHVHPETGKAMMCDREHVYTSITRWFGHGDRESALSNFDRTVRRELKEDLHRTLGKAWKIPYAYTLLVGLAPFHASLARGWHCSTVLNVVTAFEILLLRFPLCVVFTLLLCSLTDMECCSACLERLLNVAVALISAAFAVGMAGVGKDMASMKGEITAVGWHMSYFVWILLQIVGVLLFYLVLARAHIRANLRVGAHGTAVQMVSQAPASRT